MANIPGTPTHDTICGTNFDDILNQEGDLLSYPGTGGNDTILGYGGNDRLYGGAGDDYLSGGTGNDRVSGGVGDDTLLGQSGQDQLFGGGGHDYMAGGDGDDLLDGGVGSDSMNGGAGNDLYYVDQANDGTVENSDDAVGGYDRVYATATHTLGFGIEYLSLQGAAAINGTGNAQNNLIYGNAANNVLAGLDGDDVLVGVNGHDQLIGGKGNDILNGGDGNDIVNGGDGNDTLYADRGNDVVNGGAGTDTVNYISATAGVRVNLALTGSQNTGGAGSDSLTQVEIVRGSTYNDILTGNTANNSLYGEAGHDTLTGGRGSDFLRGGNGNDRFDYNAVSDSPAGAGRDFIADFAGNGAALGDQLDLRDIDANTLVTGNQAFQWRGATPGGAGTLWFVAEMLYGNVDGDAAAEFQTQLIGTPALSVWGAGTDILL